MSRKRTSHNPKFRQDWIYDYLVSSDNDIGYTEMFSIYSEKFSLSEQTFAKDWLPSSDRYKAYATRLRKKKEDAQLKAEVKFAVKSLDSKHDRLLNLQNLVDDCLRDLATGMTDDVYFDDGAPIEYRRRMNTIETNQTRRTARDIQAEISKIEADYATTKIDHTIDVMPIINLNK